MSGFSAIHYNPRHPPTVTVGYPITIGAATDLGWVGGGGDHTLNQLAGGILSGAHHVVDRNTPDASGSHSVVCGGTTNEIRSDYAGIVSGSFNDIFGSYSFIGSGTRNIIGSITDHTVAQYCVIGGGYENEILTGGYGVIPGGRGNKVVDFYGQASGYNAQSDDWGIRAFQARPFDTAVRGDNQTMFIRLSRLTTGATSTTLNPLYIDNASRLPVMPLNTRWTGLIFGHGLRTDAAGAYAFFFPFSSYYDGTTVTIDYPQGNSPWYPGTQTLPQDPSSIVGGSLVQSGGDPLFYLADIIGSAGGTGILQVRVRGVPSNSTVRWSATMIVDQVKLA